MSATPKPRADGSVKWHLYHKPTRTKLYAEPGTQDLEREAARAGRVVVRAATELTTLCSLCDDFEKSQEHLKKAIRTRQAREHYLKMIRNRWGEYEPRHLADRKFRGDIMKWRDELAATPATADALVSAIQRVMSFAYDRGDLEYDHSKGIGALSDSKPRNGMGVTAEQESALLGCAQPHERRLYLFAMFTLIRQSDLAAVKWDDINEAGWLRWKHTKTIHTSGAISFLPTMALPAFADLIAEMPRPHPQVLLAKSGVPWSAMNIRNSWVAWKIRAKVNDQDIHFHDIRREGVNRLFRAGCTEAEVSSVSGHVFGTASALSDYADISASLALSAYKKLAATMPTKPGDGKVVQFRR